MAIAIEVSFGSYLSVRGIKPDLCLLCLIFLSLKYRGEILLPFAFLTGLLKDTFSVAPWGLHAFSYCLAAYGIHYLSMLLAFRTPLSQAVMTFCASIAYSLTFAALLLGLGFQFSVFNTLLNCLYMALYNVALAPFFLWFLGRLTPYLLPLS